VDELTVVFTSISHSKPSHKIIALSRTSEFPSDERMLGPYV